MSSQFISIQSGKRARSTFRFPRLISGALVAGLLIVGAATSGSQAFASTADVERAEAMIWGTDGLARPATGRLVLEKAIQKGDIEAQRVLGMHLVYGWVLDKDVAQGFELLEQAARGGDAEAQNALGHLYLWGSAGRIDASLSQDFLTAASAQGHQEAMRTLGQQLVAGSHFEQDIPRGLELLETAALQGDDKAFVILGELHLKGRGVPYDRQTAQNYFERAAELGNGEGLLMYGEDTMWREIDAKRAEETLLKAAATGETRAYVVLANGAMYGYLGGGATSRAKYASYAEKATEAGEEYVTVLEAERLLWGIGTRASGPKAIQVLTEAAEQGNSEAASYLVGLLRDGNNLNVRKSPTEARAALDKFSGLFSEDRLDQYELTLRAERARSPAAYAPVAEDFFSRPDLKSFWFGKEIYKANPNVAIFILQSRLKEQGLYGGAVNGYATRQTLDAIYDACIATLDRDMCNDTVLRDDVIGLMLSQP